MVYIQVRKQARTMATEASLQGIQKHGLGWKQVLHISLPSDLPSKFDECETNAQVISLTQDIADKLGKSLKRYSSTLPPIILDWVRKFEEKFSDPTESEWLMESLIDELNVLYDLADYNRICLITR